MDDQPASHTAARGPTTSRVLSALGAIRRTLLEDPLDEGVRLCAHDLADTFAPALAQVWIAEPSPRLDGVGGAGGQELFPHVRLRAEVAVALGIPPGSLPGLAAPTRGVLPPQPAPRPADRAIEHVTSGRRALLVDAAHPLMREWLTAAGLAAAPDTTVSSLAIYPLQLRGQLLGALALGGAVAPDPDALAVLEAAADLCAVAIEHDRLLSYSHEREALAQMVVRQAPLAVAVLDGPAHTFALANPLFADLLGVEGSIRGRHLDDVVPGAAARLREGLRLDAVATTGEPQAMIELPIHLDRGLTYWNVTCAPLAGPGIAWRGVLVAAMDVTRQVLARQRAVEAAEVSQERVGQMMALHATSLAVASQLGADPRELLDDILRRSIALLGARAGAIYTVDRPTSTLEVIVCQGLRGDYVGTRVRLGEGLAGQVARTGQGVVMDDMRLAADPQALYAAEPLTAAIAVPLIQRGRVVGVLDMLDDADRRAFTQDDLWLLELFAAQAAQAIENARTYVALERAYQAQRDLDRMKDDFIATASHELRTPLTGVQGFLDLLVDYPGSRDDPLAREFLDRAASSAAELAELAERLLQTSRLDAGHVEPRADRVRVRALVERTLRDQSAAPLAGLAGHVLANAVPEHIVVRADERRLAEVLKNLVGNAIKYSPRGGTVRVSGWVGDREAIPPAYTGAPSRPLATLAAAQPDAARVAPAPEDPAPEDSEALPSDTRATAYAILTVSDQGIGIPAHERERLFGRFARMEAARASQIRGTGLGLYICRQMVEAMGGAIWLEESRPGQGSTFALALPLAANSPEDA
jgi:signal transduction histidine kinase